VPAGLHDGAGPRNVSRISCGRVRENVILTCTRPWTRLVLAREAGAATRDRNRGPAAAPEDAVDGADVEAALDEASRGGVVPAAAGGADGTLGAGRGGVGVGVGGTETVGAGTGAGIVGAGTVGAGTVGAGTVGAGTVGTVTVGTVTVGVVTVGTVTVGTVTVGTVSVGTSSVGFDAPTACAATSPSTGRATATSTVRVRTSPQNTRIHSSNGRLPQRDTPRLTTRWAQTTTRLASWPRALAPEAERWGSGAWRHTAPSALPPTLSDSPNRSDEQWRRHTIRTIIDPRWRGVEPAKMSMCSPARSAHG